MSKIVKKPQNLAKKKTKKELEEELALKEQTMDILAEANNAPLAVDTSSLPHFADATGGIGAGGASLLGSEGAVAGAVAGIAGLSTGAMVGLGALAVGGIAIAAGGGGGSWSNVPTDTTAPVFTSLPTATPIAENSGAGQVVYIAVATDNVGVTSYTLGGTDAGLFTIDNTGKVTLTANPDCETKSSYSFDVIAKDVAGNSATQAVTLNVSDLDELAPVFTSLPTATTAENITTSTVVYDANATDNSNVTYLLAGLDMSLFDINATTGEVRFNTSPDFDAPTDSGGNNIYDFTVRATDAAGNTADKAVAITVTDVSESPAGLGNGATPIDLGSFGKLINGVKVEGKWYYYWDRSGDGTSANTGSLNGGVDYTTHDVLDGIFKYDINGVEGGGGNTDDTYRYATLNGVHVALMTSNGGDAYPQGINHLQNGTAYTDTTEGGASDATTSAPFNELLAVWDAFNGTGTGTDINGTPSGWSADYYWSATTSASGRAYVNLDYGYVYDDNDDYYGYVALQVL